MSGVGVSLRIVPGRLLLAAGLFAAAPAALAVGGYCSAPRLPDCLRDRDGFADDAAERRCRFDLETYLAAIERQANCLRQRAEEAAQQRIDEGRRAADDVRDDGSKAAARFACKAKRGSCL